MSNVKPCYRISIRPDPRDRTQFLWTIYGIDSMFWEESSVAFSSVEHALSAGNERMSELMH
ncbi:hypothetical protein [Methylobacterium aquaticum]|uniref:hypothetical protein n=1 Tax=Methylobacterium aquaticum TaxID=270351 RepID=UPI001932EAD8|nr:hypothetical protein [Methylobacterium aquaticum]QRE73308.1 hypothetical protein F1D61_06405 [Methylobacterium aquaticum]